MTNDQIDENKKSKRGRPPKQKSAEQQAAQTANEITVSMAPVCQNPVLAIILAEELWRNQKGKPGITISREGHHEHYLLEHPQFTEWLSYKYYEQYKSGYSLSVFNDAMNTAKAKCRFEGKQYRTWSRIAEENGKISIDLGNDAWQVVEIDADSWSIADHSPIKFIRTKDMQPQCTPEKGGSIDQLEPFFNVKNRDQFILLVSFIVNCFHQQPSYPLLAISGEQGSGKTEISRMIVSLVAPQAVPTRSMSCSERELLIAALNNPIFAVDNLSSVTKKQSDWLCRLATGAGFSTRALYSDSEETTIAVSRSIILNGIDDLIERSDLLSRAIVVNIPPLAADNRKTREILWQEFVAAKPKILGALYDALSSALRTQPEVKIPADKIPPDMRMLDFVHFATAAEQGFKWGPETFLNAYVANIEEANWDSLESNPFALVVMDFCGPRRTSPTRQYTASEWITVLKQSAKASLRDSHIPIHPNRFSSQLMRIAPQLLKLGIKIERVRTTHGTRQIRLTDLRARFDLVQPKNETPAKQSVGEA